MVPPFSKQTWKITRDALPYTGKLPRFCSVSGFSRVMPRDRANLELRLAEQSKETRQVEELKSCVKIEVAVLSSWAPVPNTPTVSVAVKQHSTSQPVW